MQIHIALADGAPLRATLYEQLRQAILDGRIRPGEALPASRELARQLAVSRNTVEVVYERLAAEGFVVTRRGAGTFVSDALTPPARMRGRADGTAVLTARPVWQQIPLSRAFVDDVRYDFRTGLPDATLFPHRSWRRLIAHELRSASFGSCVYAHPAGHTAQNRGRTMAVRRGRRMESRLRSAPHERPQASTSSLSMHPARRNSCSDEALALRPQERGLPGGLRPGDTLREAHARTPDRPV